MHFMASLSPATWLQLAAGISGFVAAMLMAAPAFLSINSRKTLARAANLKLSITDQTLLIEQERVLLQNALRELEQESRFLRWGLVLLAVSFIFSIVSTFAGVSI